MTRPARGLRLRDATLIDYPQIASLECRFGLTSHSYEEWSHLWLANPVYRELGRDWSMGWVLEDGAGTIVGYLGNVPLAYELGGKRLLAASGRSWVAEPECRSLSLQLLDRVVNQPGIDLYLNTTSSVISIGPLGVFECHKVPAGVWDQSAFWVTQHRGFFETILVKRHGALLRPLTYPLSMVFHAKDWIGNSRLRAQAREVQSYDGFDERFDEFWDRLRKKYPGVLLAVRSREILEWHFHIALRDRRLWIAAVVEGGAMQAYAIFDRSDNRKLGMRRMRLVDFQSLGGDILLIPLLAWALKRCRRERMHVLESTGRWLEPDGLIRRLAPYRRRLPSWTFYYRASDAGLAQKLKRPDAWAPSLYDGDASV